ncbi:MAG: CDP-alcohol phosphatidyltransferase family protein [Clostridia bacterium]|nr:CDP-alcohol phosphatidyltransferase family protein [Clostridia bacterium]MDY5264375.1 CDP-alcohol phosphatidyltransferase family protein [Eubacteriales bacterium]
MKYDLKDVTNVPNLIVLFRMVCTPIFAGLLVHNGGQYIYWALGVFVLASVSDLFDGMIARKFNMCTAIGAVADPLADKVMHITALYSLTLIGYVNVVIAALVVAKEVIMIVCTYALKNKGIIIPANFYGKVPSALLSVGVILSFFHPYVMNVDHILMVASTILAYVAFVQYVLIWVEEYRKLKAGKVA